MGARLVTIVAVALMLAAGCVTRDGSNDPEAVQAPFESSTSTSVTPSTVDPVVAWLDGVDQNWDSYGIAKVFVEDDCVLLGSPDGSGEPMLSVWPIGTSWDPETSAIVLPDGFVVRDGDVLEIGGGAVPFDQAGGANVNAAGIGDIGLARLQACAVGHPDLEVWLLDADGSVGPAPIDE